jgi:signal peptidase I
MSKSWQREALEWLEMLVLAVVLTVLIRTYELGPFVVDGPSMQPTLYTGERLFVNKLVYHFRTPAQGDVVVFQYPPEPWRDFVKRVIGVPGDTVSISDGRVFVNGQAINEPYLDTVTYGDYPETKVPEGTLFVLGDNRNFSMDSRDPSVGFVPIKNVLGKAWAVYWPLTKVRLITR